MRIRKHRRNCRKSQTSNVVTGKTLHIGAIVLTLMVAVVVNLVADSQCTQIWDSICEKEKQLVQLERDLQRQDAAWAQMQSPYNLDNALRHHHLFMVQRKDEQVIRMDASGVPRSAQRSVELAKKRLSSPETVASASRPRNRPRR